MKSRRWDGRAAGSARHWKRFKNDFGPLADADDITMDALEDCENLDLVDVAEILNDTMEDA